MPGIDFDQVRQAVTMEQVLRLIGFEPTHQRGDQWYGHCPLEPRRPKQGRKFSVNVSQGCYYCHRCEAKGNQLTLWSAYLKRPLYPATIELCQELGCEIPWLDRW
jgi:DNA primase